VLLGVNAHVGNYRTLGQALGYVSREPSLTDMDNSGRPESGVVVSMDIPARYSHFPARPAQVYVPPAWFAHPRPKLPVVVLLHGTPGGPEDWLDGGRATVTADAWAHDHGGVAPILVMPDINGTADGDTECVDSARGRAETYLSTDVPAFIRSRLVTRDVGHDWAVAGMSEGGSCAAMLALRHPAVYSTFGDYGGLAGPRTGTTNDPAGTVDTLFAGSRDAFDQHEPARLLAGGHFPGLGGWFESGSDDGDPLAAAKQLEPLSTAAGIDTHLVVVPRAGHSPDVWQTAFADSLPWLAGRFGMGVQNPSRLIAEPRPPLPYGSVPRPATVGPRMFRTYLRHYWWSRRGHPPAVLPPGAYAASWNEPSW
jgi:S-formylglutathione hydrolase FrmB